MLNLKKKLISPLSKLRESYTSNEIHFGDGKKKIIWFLSDSAPRYDIRCQTLTKSLERSGDV